jgi:dUTP pyrophosphatase
MKVKIKKLHNNAVIPSYAKEGDAGMDLVATSKSECINNIITYGTGLSIEIPEGYVGLLFPRSSIYKQDIYLTNSVGVIDSGYRGEIMIKFAITESEQYANIYNVGDRIAQLIILPYPYIRFEEVKELSETDRNEKGFGSTGN